MTSIVGTNGDDLLTGTGGDDSIFGKGGADDLRGGGGRDALFGQTGDDILAGGDGSDTLVGGGGNDTLVGGFDNDFLTGGSGHDAFVFDDDYVYTTENITDLSRKDVIDLSGIDADWNTDGDQAFHFVSHFTGHAGDLVRLYPDDGQRVTLFMMDVYGDGEADLIITVQGDMHTFHNFVL